MSKANSRGPLQTLARNPSSMPWGHQGGKHLRSASDAQDMGRKLSHKDPTAADIQHQIVSLSNSCDKLAWSIKRKLRSGQPWSHVSSKLSDQRAKIDILCETLARLQAESPRPLAQPKVILDITADPSRFKPTSKQLQRFDLSYVNNARIYRPRKA